MSNNDIEPYLAKPIKLMLSNAENSMEQLRAILEESVRAKYGPRKAQAIANLAQTVGKPTTIKRKTSSSNILEEVPVKKIKEEIKSTCSSPTETFESASSGDDSEDLALEILEDNHCTICRSAVSNSKNRLLECLDCHNLCHQNCVSPPVEADVNDPRFVWYCSNCNKGSNRTVSNSSSRSSSSSASSAGTSGSSKTTAKSSSSTRTASGTSGGSSFSMNKAFGSSKWGRRQ